MKKFLIIILMSMTYMNMNAQAPLRKGNYQFNAGLGFSSWGIPVSAGVDFGVSHDITVGLEASFSTFNEKIYGSWYTSYVFGIAGNGNYHFNTVLEIPKKWDFYAGVSLGYYSWALPTDYPVKNPSGIGVGVQIGGRYFLNRSFGLNLEFTGGTFTGGKIGVTYALDR